MDDICIYIHIYIIICVYDIYTYIYYHKTLHWNFKYCFAQIEDVSYWRTDKQLMSNHVSLCQGMHFSIGFPMTISEL